MLPIIALPPPPMQVPHVALRLCWEARDVDDVAHAVAAMLARHGYRRACVVGHSYGSFVASRLCQLHPEVCWGLLCAGACCCWAGGRACGCRAGALDGPLLPWTARRCPGAAALSLLLVAASQHRPSVFGGATSRAPLQAQPWPSAAPLCRSWCTLRS